MSAESTPPSTENPTSAPRENGSRKARWTGATLFLERYVVIVALVVLIIVFTALRPATFASGANWASILTSQSILLVVALGLTVVLAAGELDLSIGGVIGFSAILIGQLTSNDGLSVPLALLISLIVACVVGLFNALLIVWVNVNALITTLAMGTVLVGLSSAVSNSQTIGGIPSSITNVFSGTFLTVGLPFWFALVLLLVAWYVMHQTPSGRYLTFTGEGREAARLIGVRVSRIRVIGFVTSAVAAWAGGLILVGQAGAAQTGIGDPYLLPAYAAAFLGAATIRPGRFNPVGTFVGALFLAVGTNGLQLLGLQPWVTQVFNGAILIVAVASAELLGRARARTSS